MRLNINERKRIELKMIKICVKKYQKKEENQCSNTIK